MSTMTEAEKVTATLTMLESRVRDLEASNKAQIILNDLLASRGEDFERRLRNLEHQDYYEETGGYNLYDRVDKLEDHNRKLKAGMQKIASRAKDRDPREIM